MFWSTPRSKAPLVTPVLLRNAKGAIKASVTNKLALEILTQSQGEWKPTVLTTGRGTHRYDKTWRFTKGFCMTIREVGIEIDFMPGDMLMWDDNRVAVPVEIPVE